MGSSRTTIALHDACVFAILAGRKTQHRLLFPQAPEWVEPPLLSYRQKTGLPHNVCPFGGLGDVLAVREAWFAPCGEGSRQYVFRTDGAHPTVQRWRPAAIMPREAARLFLRIVDVRVEHLHTISRADAIAEAGFACLSKDAGLTWKHGRTDRDGEPGTDDLGWPWEAWSSDPRHAFQRYWEERFNARNFALNPLVWVIGFRAELSSGQPVAAARAA